MKIPDEFRLLAGAFYQGSDKEFPVHEEWVRSRTAFLNTKQKEVARVFLDELLTNAHNDGELQAAWQAGNSCFFILDTSLRVFLTAIRDELDE